jgi:hypothetical protein
MWHGKQQIFTTRFNIFLDLYLVGYLFYNKTRRKFYLQK